MEVFTIIILTSSVKLFFTATVFLVPFCVFLICGDVLMCPFDVSDQRAHSSVISYIVSCVLPTETVFVL